MTFGRRRWIVHLSDLHLFGNPAEQATIFRSLVTALRVERRRRGADADLICLTGDVFDSATLPKAQAVRAFSELLDGMHEALGGRIPTIIVPGNHDRRRAGLFLPHDHGLFDALRQALRGRAWVHGAARPFLSEVVPPEVHGLPLWLVSYDSNHLPEGAIGAGGAMRQEDLIRAVSIIDGQRPEWPVLFLLHHHLIPTPLTDLGPIEVSRSPGPVRWLVERGLPRLLANGDREELFMTALGAGTALSTLQALGRPVLVLHGHKHYAATRLLAGTRAGQGDVLIASAGSAGVAQTWSPEGNDAARLWPSFNTLELEHDRIAIEQIAFGWREVSEEVARRPMVAALRRRARWIPVESDEEVAVEPGPRLARNAAAYRLRASSRRGRWDCDVTRAVEFDHAEPGDRYVETVRGLPDSTLVRNGREVELPAELTIDERRGSRYVLQCGSPRTVAEATRTHGRQATPFGHVALMNRYLCREATLSVRGLGARGNTAFGSATDLGTGLEEPLAVEHVGGDEVRVRVRGCAPRTLLRLYWLLEEGEADAMPSQAYSADLRPRLRDLQDVREVRPLHGLDAEADPPLDDHHAPEVVGL